ncbi:glyoxalase, partial [Methanosarcinales archaeon ex4484_138]
MALNKLAPNLMVEDVNRTVEFYQEVLGFEFVMGVIEEVQEILTSYQGDRLLDYAMVKCGDVEMMFQAKR